jgi:aspartyl-tRNA(Asn)/glutamyl-tRNA(Gln) amidotransferase subunit A
MADSDLMYLPIRELGARVKSRQVSPVKLAEVCLDRLEKLGPQLNAVVTLMRESALGEARAAEADIKKGKHKGPLHGIPFGVKDLLATKGVPTTWGAEPYRKQVFDHDATVITKLRAAGAVLCAKLAMVELAGGMGYNHPDASFTGPGLTPWNTKFWSGGSSSGPGAAVSAGLVPFAIGSETSGSILTPSAYSGVTGLRPTYGLVSRHGAMALSWTLDKVGPMGRTADDCALVLAAIAGPDPADETSSGRTFPWKELQKPTRGLRVAVPKGCVEKVQSAVRDNFEAALKKLSDSIVVTRDLELPDLPWGPAVGAIVTAEGASAFLDLLDSGDVTQLKCPADKTGGYSGLVLSAVDYLHAMRLRKPMRAAMKKLFQSYDLVATPTRGTVAYSAEKGFADNYPGINSGPPVIAAGNLTGLPALALPNGYGESGLPTSIAFMGAPFSEATLCSLGAVYQSRTDWHTKRPPAFA